MNPIIVFAEKNDGLGYNNQCEYIKIRYYHLILMKYNILCFSKSYMCYLTIYLVT